MSRYVIEMDDPTRCNDCPCLSESYAGAHCMLAVDKLGIRGKYVEEPEPWTWPRPEWCPLVELDETPTLAENDRLRELVRSMYGDLSHETFPPDWLAEYETVLAELGIEVK